MNLSQFPVVSPKFLMVEGDPQTCKRKSPNLTTNDFSILLVLLFI
jgi:hypothetical protein